MNCPTVICNTGLGDFFVFSGGFVELAKRHGHIRIPALPQYIRTIRGCLALHPEIEVFQIVNDDCMLDEYRDDPNTIRAHWTRIEQAQEGTSISWDRWAYKQFKVDFEHRWASCPLEAVANCTPQITFAGPFYLLHEDPERGFPITYPPWHPAITTRRVERYAHHTPIAWVDAIRQAKELHFIDSAMWHLANSLELRPDQPRYLHRYVRPWHDSWHNIEPRQMWHYLDGTPNREVITDELYRNS
jgi:hypothetical protein